jgi:hypothetical protein
VVVEFIDAYKERFGVEPICAVLREQDCGIAPSTYYAARKRPPSARATRDEVVVAHIRWVHGDPKIGRACMGPARCGTNYAVKPSVVSIPSSAPCRAVKLSGSWPPTVCGERAATAGS